MNPLGRYHSHPEPNSIRSEAFPSLYVTGSRLDMLSADVALSGNLYRTAEMKLIYARAEYAETHGAHRRQIRGWVLDQIADVRKTRLAYNNAWNRMSAFRIAASVARAA